MSLIYNLEGKNFSLSYAKLKEKYILFCDMPDSEFIKNIIGALHLACVICYLKEVPSQRCLSDVGIIHELVHLLDDSSETPLEEIRELFKDNLRLV